MPVSGALTKTPLAGAGAALVSVDASETGAEGGGGAADSGCGASAARGALPVTAARLRTSTRVPATEISISARPLPPATAASRSISSTRFASSPVSGHDAGALADGEADDVTGCPGMRSSGGGALRRIWPRRGRGGVVCITGGGAARSAIRRSVVKRSIGGVDGVDGLITPLCAGPTPLPRARRAASRAASSARSARFWSWSRRRSGISGPPIWQGESPRSGRRSRRRSRAQGESRRPVACREQCRARQRVDQDR